MPQFRVEEPTGRCTHLGRSSSTLGGGEGEPGDWSTAIEEWRGSHRERGRVAPWDVQVTPWRVQDGWRRVQGATLGWAAVTLEGTRRTLEVTRSTLDWAKYSVGAARAASLVGWTTAARSVDDVS